MTYTSSSLARWKYLLCSADRQCSYLVSPLNISTQELHFWAMQLPRYSGQGSWLGEAGIYYSVTYRDMAQLNCLNGGMGGWRPGSRANMALHLSPWIRHTCAPWSFQIRLYHHLQRNKDGGWDYHLSNTGWNALCQDLSAGCFNSLPPLHCNQIPSGQDTKEPCHPCSWFCHITQAKELIHCLVHCCRWFQALPGQKAYSIGQC